jgi:membrane dipeptidase
MESDSANIVPVFDGHQDILSKLAAAQSLSPADIFMQNSNNHLDRAKCTEGHWSGGFFALWVESPDDGEDMSSLMSAATYNLPLPDMLDQPAALSSIMRQTSILQDLQTRDVLTICTDIDQLRNTFGSTKLAAILHLEGCDAIDTDFVALDRLYEAGLRSLGPVWSRPTAFGQGVPFRFPATPDIGGGLTDLGIELIRRCNEKRILVDLSHLNMAGFDDVARHSQHPLLATHSNAHSLCQHARNLTDAQLEAIASSHGVVGVNFACAFLRKDGRMVSDTPVEQIIRHLDYLLERLGEHGVAIGSDFDGADVPNDIGDSSGLPVLVKAMMDHGYGRTLVNRICHANWLDVIERTWAQ